MIVRLLLRGQTNREIALALYLAEKTVKSYMAVLLDKLNARNRLEALLAAQRLPQPQEANILLDWGIDRTPVPYQLRG